MPASFVVTSFDSSGKLIEETTPLNAADPLTYEAEKLFGIDLNNDDVLGRNVKEFDRDAFTDANDIETFDGASDNKTLLTDQNSGEILFSDLSDPDLQKLLTYSDGSSFVPASTQTAIDIEQADDGSIKLLSYREAGDAINLVLKKISKKVGRRTVTEEVLSPVTQYSEAGFYIDSFDQNGIPNQETIELTAADPLTYEAEKLFGIDLNDDDVQGRNVQEISKIELANSYGWTIFESEVEEGDSGEGDDNSEEIVTPDATNNKTFTKTVEATIPQYSEEGTWTLNLFQPDTAGNDLDIIKI